MFENLEAFHKELNRVQSGTSLRDLLREADYWAKANRQNPLVLEALHRTLEQLAERLPRRPTIIPAGHYESDPRLDV
jgi:hypothetical protein